MPRLACSTEFNVAADGDGQCGIDLSRTEPRMKHRTLSRAEKCGAAACLVIIAWALGYCAVEMIARSDEPNVEPVAAGPQGNDDGLSYIPPADKPFTGEHHEPLQMVMDLPGAVDPIFANASSTVLADSEEVLGVIVGDKAYAFSRQAMLDPNRHIINFEVDQRPISVTYCDMVQQGRVLTRPSGTGPIDLHIGGMDMHYQLVLLLDGTRYGQSSAALPLEDYPFERTTLREWIALYPDTFIFEG